VKFPEKLAPLRRAGVECLVVSTAKCERSFSVMNDVTSDIRSLLGIKRISALMFAKLLGPNDIIVFNLESYFTNGERGRHIAYSADHTASRITRDQTKHHAAK